MSKPATASRPSSFSAKRPAISSVVPFSRTTVTRRRRADDGVADHHRRHLACRDLADLAAADPRPASQHREVVTESLDLAELVADHGDGDFAPVRHVAQKTENLVSFPRRQHGRRLVEDQEALIEIEQLQDFELLLLARRQPETGLQRHAERHRVKEPSSDLLSLRQSIIAGASARLATRFSAAVNAGTRVKC